MSGENPQNLLGADTKKNKIFQLRCQLVESIMHPIETLTQAKKTETDVMVALAYDYKSIL